CCMAAVKPGHYEPEDTLVVQGTWEGRILNEAIGENGFGYDPVFCDIIMGVTAAQMSAEDKMARSHRGNALRSLVACWQDWISTPPVH
ncbi:MAG: non-canonical purine NTP pyrophosphatase, partial [Desulfovibrio sp.]|nr:non-canonical purine NTP pyrophosphatase [Desulfovibrio sp.]